MLLCCEMGEVPKDDENLILFLTELARKTVVLNPQLALPFPRLREEERGEGAGEGGGEAAHAPEESVWMEVNQRGVEEGVAVSEVVSLEERTSDIAGEASVSSISDEDGELGESD